jgi:Fe-S-cluster containining protein
MTVKRYSCGSCNVCCNLLAVVDLDKPPRQWCHNALRPHGGCAIYPTRPEACKTYECLWLQSQNRVDEGEVMPIGLRPNRSGVLFALWDEDNPKKMYVHVAPENADRWRQPMVMDYINTFRMKGATIEVIIGSRRVVLEPENEECPA